LLIRASLLLFAGLEIAGCRRGRRRYEDKVGKEFVTHRKQFKLRLSSRTLELGARTLVMGVLNVTPDSFSDGGKFFSLNRAIDAALAMEAAGADILDIGGESTRPGSNAVLPREELARVLPVLNRLSGRLKIPISIDTRRSAIADAAIAAGAQIINDVTGLRFDPEIAGVACRNHVPLILMHMRGEPRTMQEQPFARNAVQDVLSGLKRSIAIALKAGVPKSQIIVDPGIGFGKSFRQNYELIARLGEIASLGYPILIGTSRKTFLGTTLDGKPPEDRIWGTAATVAASILAGAHIVRVHDVEEMVQVARVTDKVLEATKG
jgi:dihydropteroate synthase